MLAYSMFLSICWELLPLEKFHSLNMNKLQLLNIGLDDQESPLEASRWLLSNNPIPSSFCQQKDLPYLFEFHCSVHSQENN